MSYCVIDNNDNIVKKDIESIYDLNGSEEFGLPEFAEPKDSDFHTLDDDIEHMLKARGYRICEEPYDKASTAVESTPLELAYRMLLQIQQGHQYSLFEWYDKMKIIKNAIDSQINQKNMLRRIVDDYDDTGCDGCGVVSKNLIEQAKILLNGK